LARGIVQDLVLNDKRPIKDIADSTGEIFAYEIASNVNIKEIHATELMIEAVTTSY
jgi:hypothetical protein